MIIMGGQQRRYICGTYHAGGEHACPNRSTFARELAERHILEPVINDLLSPADSNRRSSQEGQGAATG